MATATTLPEFPFQPAAAGSWKVIDRHEANHESQHCVAAILLDLEVLECRIDRLEYGYFGVCSVRYHRERWRNAGAAIAPLVLAGTAPSLPDLLAAVEDVRVASEHWRASGRPDDKWPEMLTLVRELLLLPSSRRMITAVAGELLQRGALDGDEVRRLVDGSD